MSVKRECDKCGEERDKENLTALSINATFTYGVCESCVNEIIEIVGEDSEGVTGYLKSEKKQGHELCPECGEGLTRGANTGHCDECDQFYHIKRRSYSFVMPCSEEDAMKAEKMTYTSGC